MKLTTIALGAEGMIATSGGRFAGKASFFSSKEALVDQNRKDLLLELQL